MKIHGSPLTPCLWSFLVFTTATPAGAQTPWQRTYGGYGVDKAYDVEATPDSGFILLGSTGSFGNGGGDVYLMKIDGSGDLQWSRTYGGPEVDEGRSIAVLDDGGYAIVGAASIGADGDYEGLLMRTDAAGDVLWQQHYGGPDWDVLRDICVLADGFAMVGQTYSSASGTGDIWVVRTDLLGNTLWTCTVDSPGTDAGNGIASTPDGSIVVAGSVRSLDGDDDCAVVRLHPDGSQDWSVLFGGDSADVGYSIATTVDGGFVVGGYSESYTVDRTMYMVRLNDVGDEIWSRTTSGGTGDWEGHRILQLPDEGFLLAGYSSAFGAGMKDFYMWHTDPQGFYVEGPTFGGTSEEEAWGIALAPDGGYVLAGSTKSYGPGPEAVYVVRNYGSPNIPSVVETFDPVGVAEAMAVSTIGIFPNPAPHDGSLRWSGLPPSMTTELVAYDLSGRLVMEWALKPGDRCNDLNGLAPGSYHLVLSSKQGVVHSATLIVQ